MGRAIDSDKLAILLPARIITRQPPLRALVLRSLQPRSVTNVESVFGSSHWNAILFRPAYPPAREICTRVYATVQDTTEQTIATETLLAALPECGSLDHPRGENRVRDGESPFSGRINLVPRESYYIPVTLEFATSFSRETRLQTANATLESRTLCGSPKPDTCTKRINGRVSIWIRNGIIGRIAWFMRV